MKKRRNSDDTLRKVERNRLNSLEDAARYVEENLRRGRVVFSRPFVDHLGKNYYVSGLSGVMDFSNGYSLWCFLGHAQILINELVKAPKGWVNRETTPPAYLMHYLDREATQKAGSNLDTSKLYLLNAYPREPLIMYIQRRGRDFAWGLHKGPKSAMEDLHRLATKVASWQPISEEKSLKNKAAAQKRGLLWFGD